MSIRIPIPTLPVARRSAYVAGFVLLGAHHAPAADPLPSWNEGLAKRAIVTFVSRVTTPGSPDFVPQAERIATFDNDGTLWVEKPLPTEVYFVLSRIHELALRDSSLKSRQPYKAALEGDAAYFQAAGAKAVVELVLAAETSMPQEQFAADARQFIAGATNPALHERFTALAYQPMLELLSYLRANGFQTWICSGGTTDFMRAFALLMYGVPPEQVIGSEFDREARTVNGRLEIWRLPKAEAPNDKAQKPVNIDAHIGMRPLFAAGNILSGGDVAMLEYSKGRRPGGSSLQLIVHHDDAAREFAYEERDSASLKAAAREGFVVVSMHHDWKTIFAPHAAPAAAR